MEDVRFFPSYSLLRGEGVGRTVDGGSSSIFVRGGNGIGVRHPGNVSASGILNISLLNALQTTQ